MRHAPARGGRGVQRSGNERGDTESGRGLAWTCRPAKQPPSRRIAPLAWLGPVAVRVDVVGVSPPCERVRGGCCGTDTGHVYIFERN